MKKEKGSAKIAILIIVLVLIAGAIYFLSSDNSTQIESQEEINTGEDETMEASSDVETDSSAKRQGSRALNEANNVLVYTDPEGLDLALQQSGAELAVLYFYADWCPLCKEEFPKLISAMDELKDLPVLAFQVNFKDSFTDEFDEALAKEHGIAYQHTKVFLVNGERVLKSPETWDKSRYIEEIKKVLQ